MPPGKPDLSGYNYGAISSLVLTADKTGLPRRDREPDGTPETLVGRIDPRQMGSRVQRAAPKDLEKKKKKATERSEAAEKPARRKAAETTGFGYADVIEATQDVEGLTYRPRTAETREVYELMLATVHQALGDQANDIVRSAADTVLETLKNDSLKDFDKKKEIEELLGSLPNDTFSQLINLSKKITDYGIDENDAVDPDIERKDAEIDEEMGVAVVFDEEEQEEDDDEGFEVGDESDEDAEENQEQEEDTLQELGENDELVLGGELGERQRKGEKSQDTVAPHEVDGFWVQRQVTEVYPDPVTATEKATAVLSILGSESSLRDCENQLMELFDYNHFEIITKFLKNREVIVWCTKLVRSDANERINVEVAMREKGVGWILRELAGDRKAKASTSGDKMDVDENHKAQQTVPKTGTLAPGSIAHPRQILDLEGMAFSQGGHLMSNKKCKLPEGSFKRSKKGYEEIHVPAPKKKDVDKSEIVPISSLPEWAQVAFPGIKELNRVQSKLYPVAFGQDDPILLCAPTGAGKVG